MSHQWKVGDKFRCNCCAECLVRIREVDRIGDVLWDKDGGSTPFEWADLVDLEKKENDSSKGDPRFHALLKQLGELHDRKQADYGTPDDPFANYRASEDIGIPAWKNAFMRGIEKVNRIKAFIRNGSLKNEGVEDAFMDLAVCSMIALIEYRETVKSEGK